MENCYLSQNYFGHWILLHAAHAGLVSLALMSFKGLFSCGWIPNCPFFSTLFKAQYMKEPPTSSWTPLQSTLMQNTDACKTGPLSGVNDTISSCCALSNRACRTSQCFIWSPLSWFSGLAFVLFSFQSTLKLSLSFCTHFYFS